MAIWQRHRSGWVIVILLFVFTLLGTRIGLGGILNIVFPLFSLLVGIYLYSFHPTIYVSFTLWLWFLTALLRRLADYWSSYTEPSPMLLAPFLVTGITIPLSLKCLPKAKANGSLPFAMSFIGVTYGFLIGLVSGVPLVSLLQSLLGWITPISFGWYLYLNWRKYLGFQKTIQQTFLWGVLIMGIYGIIQFMALPEWDRLWLEESKMFSATGMASETGGMRIWSTMHSGEPFGAFMAVGLLILLSNLGNFSFMAAIPGYISFLLSTVRSAWLGWFGGLLIMMSNLKPNVQMRLIGFALAIGIAVVPLSLYQPFAEKIVPRVTSFSALSEDESGQSRQGIYTNAAERANEAIIGRGIGQGVGDSGILSLFFELGWMGGGLYIVGIILITFQIFNDGFIASETFSSAVKAGLMSCFIRAPLNSVFVGASAVLLWALLGLGLASSQYFSKKKYLVGD